MIDPATIQLKKYTDMPRLKLALQNIITQAAPDGKVSQFTVSEFMAYLAPRLTTGISSGFVQVEDNVLPKPNNRASWSWVGLGTFTMDGATVLTTTSDLNFIFWNGSTWEVLQALNLTAPRPVFSNNIADASAGVKLIITTGIDGKQHLSNILDKNTGEVISATETADIAASDNIIYWDYAGKKYKRDTNGVYQVKWWAKGDGVTNDTINIQNALNSDAKVLDFGGFGTRYLTGYITLTGDNKQLISHGAVIANISGYTGYYLLNIGNSIKYQNTNFTISLIKGQATIVNAEIAAQCEIGDIIKILGAIRYTDPITAGTYNHGLYTSIVDKVGDTLYINVPSSTDFTSTALEITKPISNLTIKNLVFELDGTTTTTPLRVNEFVNLSIQDCVLKAINSISGIVATGISALITGNNIQGFRNNSIDNTAYGIATAGHNITVEGNTIKKGKHTISGSSRDFISTNIRVIANFLYSDEIYVSGLDRVAVLDLHGNIIGGLVEGNNVFGNVAAMVGILIRCAGINVIDNIVRITRTTTNNTQMFGLYCHELFEGGCEIRGNKFYVYNPNGTVIPMLIGLATTPTEINDLSVSENYSNRGTISLSGNIGLNINIFENVFDADADEMAGKILISTVPKSLRIYRNRFRIRTTAQTTSIDMEAVTTADVSIPLVFEDNDITFDKNVLNGRILFRSKNGISRNNRFRTDLVGTLTDIGYNDVSTTKENLVYDNTVVRSTGVIIKLAYLNTKMPTASEFFINMIIAVATTATIHTVEYYRCDKTASTYLWVKVPKTAATSTNTAIAAVGANPTTAEFNALLNDFKDLKLKLVAAGLQL